MIGRAVLLVSACVVASGQSAFEVASIHPYETPPPGALMSFSSSGPRAAYKGYGVKGLVMEAYDLRADFVTFAAPPPWIDVMYYDLAAKAEGEAPRTRAEFRAMLQRLLAERFHLAIHREQREMPVYTLVLGKGGPKFKESGSDTAPYFLGSVNGRNQYITVRKRGIDAMVDALGNFLGVDRPVIDKTGLTGTYDYRLEATPGWRRDTEPGDLSIFTAVQEQLGLKLEPGKAPVEVLVVDRVEKPSEN